MLHHYGHKKASLLYLAGPPVRQTSPQTPEPGDRAAYAIALSQLNEYFQPHNRKTSVRGFQVLASCSTPTGNFQTVSYKTFHSQCNVCFLQP